MKKVILILLLSVIVLFNGLTFKAEEYQNYQEIIFDNDEAYLIKDLKDSDYKELYKEIKKKKFMGWIIDVVNENEPVEFISETKLKVHNNGYTSIKQDISLETKEETKYQISASGGIKLQVKGDVKKFKGTVDADIKASVSYSKLTT
ncbi:MAG: hypothetical protein WC152_05940, partial [Candidatus Izemoplasmatales bacterium]